MVDKVIYNCPCQCSRCGTIYLSGVKLSGGYILKTLQEKTFDPTFRYKPQVQDLTDIWQDLPFLNIEFDCPKCEKGNLINPFLIDLIEDSIEGFKKIPIDKLIELQHKLKRKVQQSGSFSIQDFEDSKKYVLDVIPELQTFKDYRPKTRNEAYAFMTLIVTIIGILVSLLKGETTEKPQIEQVISQTNITNIYNLHQTKENSIKPDLRKKPILKPFKKRNKPK